ncbi:MAG TPA: hypothetical protein V6C86_11080 [Oculatellaceae cyanobacterium]
MSGKFIKSSKTLISSLLASSSVVLLAAGMASAKEDFYVDTSAIGQSKDGVVQSDQLLELGTPTADSLRLEGEQFLRMGNLDRAIMVLQKSVEMAPSDMDGRILYATALEKKLKSQDDRDPQLYNFLVKQWLYVLKKADFLDQNAVGQSHLVALTGTYPRKYESRARFLSRVMLPLNDDAREELNKRKFTAAKTDPNTF